MGMGLTVGSSQEDYEYGKCIRITGNKKKIKETLKKIKKMARRERDNLDILWAKFLKNSK